MKIAHYEIAALRERLRSARKEMDLVETILRSRQDRMDKLRTEIEHIEERIEHYIEHTSDLD